MVLVGMSVVVLLDDGGRVKNILGFFNCFLKFIEQFIFYFVYVDLCNNFSSYSFYRELFQCGLQMEDRVIDRNFDIKCSILNILYQILKLNQCIF